MGGKLRDKMMWALLKKDIYRRHWRKAGGSDVWILFSIDYKHYKITEDYLKCNIQNIIPDNIIKHVFSSIWNLTIL